MGNNSPAGILYPVWEIGPNLLQDEQAKVRYGTHFTLWRCNWANLNMNCTEQRPLLKTDQGTTWKNSNNRDQYTHNEKDLDILTQAFWVLSNEKYEYC